MCDLTEPILELICLASTDLPPDVEVSLHESLKTGRTWLAARRAGNHPQKRGAFPAQFHAHLPGYRHAHLLRPLSRRLEHAQLREQIRAAMAEATKKSYLRPNAVDSLTGKNTRQQPGRRAFPHHPFRRSGRRDLTIELMLKGGGCENVGAQYSLPDDAPGRGARPGRGAQGRAGCGPEGPGEGCAPGYPGRGHRRRPGLVLLSHPRKCSARKMDETNPDPELAALEERLTDEANQLGIGPMGFGGKTTVLGTKITGLHRLPASLFRHRLVHVLGVPPAQAW